MTKEDIKKIMKGSVRNNGKVYVLCNCGGYTAHFTQSKYITDINICNELGIRVISIYNHNECHITNEGKKSLDMAMFVTIMEQFRLPVRLSSHYTHSGYAVGSAEEIEQYARLFSFSDRVQKAYTLWQDVKPDKRDIAYMMIINEAADLSYMYNCNDDYGIDDAEDAYAKSCAEYDKDRSHLEKEISALGERYVHNFFGKIWSLCLQGKDWREIKR